MVANGLKGIAVKTAFTDQVLARIQGARVQIGRPPNNCILLTDEHGRSFFIGLRPDDARALAPLYHVGFEALDPFDLRSVLVRLLAHFHCRVAAATVHELRGCEFRCTLEVEGLHGKQCVACRIEEAMPLAVASRAPFLVAEELAEGMAFRRQDGKPCTPRGAWRKLHHLARETTARNERIFPDLEAVFRALKDDPQDRAARNALRQAPWEDMSTLPEHMCTLEDRTNGIETVVAWEARCRDTEHEQLAAALTGAMLLWSARDPDMAIPYLERVHAMDPCPWDWDCVQNLATAYVRAGRREKAIELLRGCPQIHKWARVFGNLRDLWSDPRFAAICGPPETGHAHIIDIGEFNEIVFGKAEDGEGLRPDEPQVIELTAHRDDDTEAIDSAANGETMPAVRLHIPPETGPSSPDEVELELANGRRVHVRTNDDGDCNTLWHGLGRYTTPDDSLAMCVVNVLRAAGIAPQCVLLRETGCTDLAGELVGCGEGSIERIPGRATDLVAVAVRADVPIRIAVCGTP